MESLHLSFSRAERYPEFQRIQIDASTTVSHYTNINADDAESLRKEFFNAFKRGLMIKELLGLMVLKVHASKKSEGWDSLVSFALNRAHLSSGTGTELCEISLDCDNLLKLLFLDCLPLEENKDKSEFADKNEYVYSSSFTSSLSEEVVESQQLIIFRYYLIRLFSE
ncbi:hypothetical protein Tco_1148206 [Tanacetum coccineum]